MLADFRRARPLLFDLAADIHPDRWTSLGIPATGVMRLTACPRARATLSERLDWLDADADVDFTVWHGALAEKPGAWALLPGGALWRAARRLGAGRHRPEIARLIRREDVAAFKAAAGEDAWLFALRQAPMLWRAAPLADDAETASEAAPAERVLASAGLALGCWLAVLPAGLSARARMKLPPAREPEYAVAASWPEERRGAWLAALSKVFALEG